MRSEEAQLAHAVRLRFRRTRDLNDLEDGIKSLRAVLAAGSADAAGLSEIQVGLAASLRDRYTAMGVPRDLDEAIELTETVLAALPAGDMRAAGFAADLGTTLRERFEAAGDVADIDASIGWLKRASDQVSGADRLRPLFLADRARSHQVRYGRLRDAGDRDAAIRLLREAVDTGHPRPGSLLTVMLGMLRDRFERGGDPAGLDAVIKVGHEALALPSTVEGSRQWLRLEMIDAYLERFDRTAVTDDLEAAVRLSQENIDDFPPSTPQWLIALGTARRKLSLHVAPDRIPDQLRAHPLFDYAALKDPDQLAREAAALLRVADRADRTGALNIAIWLLEQALPGFTLRSDEWLDAKSDLGAAIGLRGGRTGSLEDVNEAISTMRQVLDAAGPDHSRWHGFQSNLASAFRYRFLLTGRRADLDAAVEMARGAASARHPRRAMYLSNLASLLNDRYEYLGSVTDVEEAITVNREAVAATDPDDPNRARNLSNLAMTLLGGVKATNSEARASEAIAAMTEALSLTPDGHPSRAMRLENLGTVYQFRYQLTRKAADLDHSVRYYRMAVRARADDDPDRARSLSGLGMALVAQHLRTGGPGQLNEGIGACAEAVASSPPGHPEFQLFLGNALETRYEATANAEDAAAALDAYRGGALADTGPASSRLSAAQAWGNLAMSLPGQRASALAGYTTAAELLHRVAWRGLTRSDREQALTRWPELPGDMAACALARQLSGRAVELLENSRSVIWSQMLDLRTDLSETPVCDREADAMMARLEQIRDALDDSGHPGVTPWAVLEAGQS